MKPFHQKFFRSARMRRHLRALALGLLGVAFLSPPEAHAQAQTLTGSNFLKLVPGARQQGLAGIGAGVIDELHALYANPGAAGFSREWQWAATYSKTIAEAYHASLIYGTHLRTPWSRRSHLSFGLGYQGMPDFDSSDGAVSQVSANDVLAVAGFSQPFTIAGKMFALGANLKYFRSKLAQYEAEAWMADAGLLYRSARFRLLKSNSRFLNYGIISAGVGVTNVGNDLTFQTSGTPLPRTWRAGMAFNAGHHQGLQIQLAADYRRVHTERGGALSFGAEISWGQMLSLRGGYDFHDDLLSHVAMGLSLRLGDGASPIGSVLPGRNNTLRLDLAAMEQTDLFSRPYRGSVTHYPVGPEGFDLRSPAPGTIIDSDSVALQWQEARDPDLYDDAKYLLLVERDSLRLAETLALAQRSREDFFQIMTSTPFLIKLNLTREHFQLNTLEGGDYFWSVLAYDSDQHVRAAGPAGRNIWRFTIPAPQLEITSIAFDYDQWITQSDYQGILRIAVANAGKGAARNVRLAIYDSLSLATASETNSSAHAGRKLLADTTLAMLIRGAADTLAIPWHTSRAGLHMIAGELSDGKRHTRREAEFYTIPKGTFAASDTVRLISESQISYEIPLVPEICFDPNSSEVKPAYLHKDLFEPPLVTVAQRLRTHRQLKIYLKGFADPNSGEHQVALADARAAAVLDSLVAFGVNADQIAIQPGEVLPPRRTPANADDARWVMEERRYVKISTDKAGEVIAFQLVPYDDVEQQLLPVVFASSVASAVPLQSGLLQTMAGGRHQQLELEILSRQGFTQEILWQPGETNINDVEKLVGGNLAYTLLMNDSLGRTFYTPPAEAYLSVESSVRAQRVAWPLRFNATAPLYDFYWDELIPYLDQMLNDPDVRMRFSGHACAIGSEEINMRLSQQRAQAFQQTFLARIKEHYPQSYNKIIERLDGAVGRGEARPMGIAYLSGSMVVLGDNESPLGRKLNRRLEIEFYYPTKRAKTLTDKR